MWGFECYLCLYMCIHIHIYVDVLAGSRWGHQKPWSWSYGGCELPALGSGHQTQAIWKSRKCFIYCAVFPASEESLRARLGDSV